MYCARHYSARQYSARPLKSKQRQQLRTVIYVTVKTVIPVGAPLHIFAEKINFTVWSMV